MGVIGVGLLVSILALTQTGIFIPLVLTAVYVHDHLTDFLEEVKEQAKFHYWLFGHYHDNKIIDDRFVLLWEQMVQVV